jgi:hypothetical protein
MSFYYYQEIEFKHIHPPAGSEFGGTNVTLRGRFPLRDSVFCMFGDQNMLPALSSSIDSITCRTPPAPLAFLQLPMIPIAVSFNGLDVEQSQQYFRYLQASYVSKIEPDVVHKNGAVLFRLYGYGFPPSLRAGILCLFGKFMRTEARILNESSIECSVPYSNSTGVFPITVSFNFGVESIPSFTTITVLADPQARPTQLSPKVISNAGGVTVGISGENFHLFKQVVGNVKVVLNSISVEGTGVCDNLITLSPKTDDIGNCSIQLLANDRVYAFWHLTLSFVSKPSLLYFPLLLHQV